HHRRDDRAREVQRAVEDDPPDGLPVLYGQLGEGLVWPDRSIVDQDVDTSELGHCPRRQRLDLVLSGDIGDHRERLDPKAPGLAYDCVGLGLLRARVDTDVRAFSGQLQPRRTADIAARAGYQGDFPVELTHQRTSIIIFCDDPEWGRYGPAACAASHAAFGAMLEFRRPGAVNLSQRSAAVGGSRCDDRGNRRADLSEVR